MSARWRNKTIMTFWCFLCGLVLRNRHCLSPQRNFLSLKSFLIFYIGFPTGNYVKYQQDWSAHRFWGAANSEEWAPRCCGDWRWVGGTAPVLSGSVWQGLPIPPAADLPCSGKGMPPRGLLCHQTWCLTRLIVEWLTAIYDLKSYVEFYFHSY